MKSFLFLFVLLTSAILLHSQIRIDSILKKSQQYYESLSCYSITFDVINKPSFAIDSAKWTGHAIIDRSQHLELFEVTPVSSVLVLKNRIYLIDPIAGKWQQLSTSEHKFSIYFTTFIEYPFVNNSRIFKILNKISFSCTENDSLFFLHSKNINLEIRKEDYSFKKISKAWMDHQYDDYYIDEVYFKPVISDRTRLSQSISNAKKLILDPNKETDFTSIDSVINNFDRMIFETQITNHINFDRQKIENKIILLDFFYEGCLPCLKSHPAVNQLHNLSDSTFMVIGVNPNLQDTLNLENYINKNKITYPVIFGYSGMLIAKELNVKAFPTFILIDQSGKVIHHQSGYDKFLFRKVSEKLKEVNMLKPH